MLDRLLEIEKQTRSLESTSEFADRQTVLIAPTREVVERETQAIGSVPRHTTQPLAANHASALTFAAARRRKRGYWLFVLVLLFTASAAGTGWYFGSGPGANVSIPAVAGLDPRAAATALEDSSFAVTLSSRPDLAVPAGQSSGTEPAEGSLVRKGSTIMLFTSTGPRQLPVPDVVGMTQSKASAELTTAGFTVLPDPPTEFSRSNSRGAVLSVHDSTGSPLGPTYGEQQPISLVVSAGGIPNVAGKTVDDARSALDDVGLKIASGNEIFSDTVAEGLVIESSIPADVVRPGDTITVTISRGPEPVPVPNVIGIPWGQAKKILSDASFALSYDVSADLVPLLVRVTGTDPVAGQLAKKGSTVTVKFL